MSPRPNAALQRSAPIFAALGDGPLSISQLTEGTEVTRQAITKHLEVLAGAGVVRDFRQGRERMWELRTQQLEQARRALDLISAQWDDALERLRAALED